MLQGQTQMSLPLWSLPWSPLPSLQEGNNTFLCAPITLCTITLITTVIVRELLALLYLSLTWLWAPWGQRLILTWLSPAQCLASCWYSISACRTKDLVGGRGAGEGIGVSHQALSSIDTSLLPPSGMEEPATAGGDLMGLGHAQVRILLPNTKFCFILFSGQLWSTKKWHAIFILLPMKKESDRVFCSSLGSWAPAGQSEYEAMVWYTATYTWDTGIWTNGSQSLRRGSRSKMLTGWPGSTSSWWEKGAETHSVVGGGECRASAEWRVGIRKD